MLGFFKNLLRKSAEPPAVPQQPPGTQGGQVQPAYTLPAERPASTGATVRSNGVQKNGNGHGVELSLQKILNGLPVELQPQVRLRNVGDITIRIPLEKVLAQLSRGAVRIPFGDLRHAAPDVFNPAADRDQVLVTLPLAEILSQLSPGLIVRRRIQRQIEVPPDIVSPFEGRGPGLAVSPSMGRTTAAAAPTAAPSEVAPVNPSTANPPARGDLNTVTPISTPELKPGPSRNGLTTSFTPASPLPFSPGGVRQPHDTTPPRAPVQPTPATPVPPTAPATSMQGGTANPFGGRPARDLVGGHSAPAAKPVADPLRAIPAGELLEVPLASLCEAWPEVLRKEIVSLGLVDAKVALPLSLVEQGLRKGRVNFDWKTLRLFVRPAMPPSTSPHDSVVAELPLKVVAPLFLTRKSEAAQAKQRVAVDEEIPNLFFGTPHSDSTTFAQVAAPAPLAPASARPGDTNFYAREDYQDATRAAAMESRRGPTPGTKFAVKYATPNEIVSRASELPGVVGALIALPDGLMVANRLPSDLNADTLAAFLPQIYAKVSQCTKELRMGELNNLNFTVGNVPWKIFRVNAIFFAAFGRPGEPLPTAQLAALAAELDHKPK